MRNRLVSILRGPAFLGVVLSLTIGGLLGLGAVATAKPANCEGLDEQACTQLATKLAASHFAAKRAQGEKLLSEACEFDSASACNALHTLASR